MSHPLPYRPRDEDDGGRDGEDDDEEEVDEAGYKTVKDAILFAIDVSVSMLKCPPRSDSKKTDASSPLLAALKCAYHLMQQRIISNPKDMMGILLYNTEKTKFLDETDSGRGAWAFPHCYLLIDLDVPEAQDVKTLRRLVDDEEVGANDILQPAKDTISMHHVLFCANQIFQTKAPNFTSRRLFIVTDNDDPHATEKQYRNSAVVRAKDLYDLGVTIELFPISTPGHTFDTTLFYDDIVYKNVPSDPNAIAYTPSTQTGRKDLVSGSSDGISLLQSLLSEIASKATAKRTLFSSVPLELAPELRISVKGYLLYKRQMPARSSYIFLGAERPQLAVGNTQQVAGDTPRNVEKFEIRKAFTFGGEQVVFTPEEIKELRNFGDPVIRLVGFKPRAMLPLWANFKSSTFLYPSEDDYVGSTRVFSALHQKLLKSNLMALTWFVARRNAAPVLAALVPTHPAPDSDTGSNVAGVSSTGCPQGLHLIPLPFADDIRQNPPMPHDRPVVAPDALLDKMRPIIQQLNLPKGVFDPSKYPNPSLQWFYRVLQAMALDEDLPEHPDDKTRPKYKQIDKRVGHELAEWQAELDRSYREYAANNPNANSIGIKAGAKRAAPLAPGEGGGKKIKIEDGDVISEEDMRSLWQKGKIASLKVTQLKEFCTAKKISVSGNKAALVESIESWFESK